MSSLLQAIPKGTKFENIFYSVVEPIAREHDWLLLHNVWLPSPRKGHHSQTDFVLLTPYRYFCIETKDWDCEVFCSENIYWETKYGDRIIRTLSPMQQNIGHINRLSHYVPRYKWHSMICYSDSAILRNNPETVKNFQAFQELLYNLPYTQAQFSWKEIVHDYLTINKAVVETMRQYNIEEVDY